MLDKPNHEAEQADVGNFWSVGWLRCSAYTAQIYSLRSGKWHCKVVGKKKLINDIMPKKLKKGCACEQPSKP
jgi:hypothetical protein